MNIENNNITKINKAINKNKDTYVALDTFGKGIYEELFTFNCREHGSYYLKGFQLRMGKSCPECQNDSENQIFKTFNSLTETEKLNVLRKARPEYNYTNVMELDNTIRPECNDHGEFLTTPRKLINGDACKWCDGIIVDTDGNTSYPLDRTSRLQERNDNIDITYINPYKILVENTETKITNELKLKDFFGNSEYQAYLKKLRDPSNHNAIFFKMNITDRSTKFQFCIVHVIYLNEKWYNWYLAKIAEGDDTNDVQEYTTRYIVEEWFHELFYGQKGDTLSKREVQFLYEIQHYEWSVPKRISLKALQYYRKNENKSLILPEAITQKINYDLSTIGIHTYWSENKWDSTSTSISLIRESILKHKQLCPICSRPIKDPVVDHEHKKKIKGSGRVRDNICSLCNVFIAKTENNCKRYKIEIAELPQVLMNLSGYFSEQQYNVVHYTDKDKRPTITKTQVSKILKHWELLYPTKKKPTAPKSGILTKDWEEYLNTLEEYLKNPFQPLGKLVYNKLVCCIIEENAKITEILLTTKLPKTKQPKLIKIPEYPKLKVVTLEIAELLQKFNKG